MTSPSQVLRFQAALYFFEHLSRYGPTAQLTGQADFVPYAQALYPAAHRHPHFGITTDFLKQWAVRREYVRYPCLRPDAIQGLTIKYKKAISPIPPVTPNVDVIFLGFF